MSFRVIENDTTATVYLTGEVDLENSPAARTALLATVGRGRSIVVDMGGVTYIDSSGIASLVEAYQKAKSASVEFALDRVGAPVLKVLLLARLDKVFNIRSRM